MPIHPDFTTSDFIVEVSTAPNCHFTKEEMAVHEAGHVVVAVVLGVGVAGVSMKPSAAAKRDGTRAYVRITDRPARLDYLCAFLFAGPLAQMMYSGRANGGHRDVLSAIDLVREAQTNAPPEVLDAAFRIAHDVLHHPAGQSAVELIANRMAQQSRVSGKVIERVVAKAIHGTDLEDYACIRPSGIGDASTPA